MRILRTTAAPAKSTVGTHGLKKQCTSQYRSNAYTWHVPPETTEELEDVETFAREPMDFELHAEEELRAPSLDDVWPEHRTEETADEWDIDDRDEDFVDTELDEEANGSQDGCGDKGIDWEKSIRAALVDEAMRLGASELPHCASFPSLIIRPCSASPRSTNLGR